MAIPRNKFLITYSYGRTEFTKDGWDRREVEQTILDSRFVTAESYEEARQNFFKMIDRWDVSIEYIQRWFH